MPRVSLSPWRLASQSIPALSLTVPRSVVGYHASGADLPAPADRLGLYVDSKNPPISFSIPRSRDAGGMPSSFTFPIGPHHPDLARPRQSRSCPLPAPVVMRSDHANYPFHRRHDGDVLPYCTRHADGRPPGIARDRFPASEPGTGLRAIFQVDTLATSSGTNFSCPRQAIGAGHRLACRRHPPLDRAARGLGVIAADRPRAARWKLLYVGRVSTDFWASRDMSCQVGGRPIAAGYRAFGLIRKSPSFPGDFAWQRRLWHLNIRERVWAMGDSSHAS